MTIAIISMIRDPWGGSEELWYDMAKEAIASGHKVIHLRFEHPVVAPKIQELMVAGVRCFTRPGYIKPGSGPFSRLVQIGINFLRKKLRNPFRPVFDHQPDIILYNGTCYSIAGEIGLMQKVLKSGAEFYLLGHLNSDLVREVSDNEAGAVLNAYRSAKKVFFVSERSYRTAERHLAASINNGMVVRNPVNLDDYSTIPFPSIEPAVQFALVGRLYTCQKGQDVLLQALASETWQQRKWILNIYGDGPDKNYLQNLVRHYSLGAKVFFHGNVSAMRQVWLHNHMLLMPSLMEGMPLAVVEAMLCGRPCLVTDVGGNSEWIQDGRSGFIAAAATVNALKYTLERAWQVLPEWSSIGDAAAIQARGLFDRHAGRTLLGLMLQSAEKGL